MVFTHKPYPELKSALYVKGFEDKTQVGDLFEFSGWNGKKYYDQLNYVNWFNGKGF
ncbi:exopolysaccharide biosynthesis protein [Actinobacillus equuli]|nr:exopolysaccharide biosynthesis protein [Actinobacillus equuli]